MKAVAVVLVRSHTLDLKRNRWEGAGVVGVLPERGVGSAGGEVGGSAGRRTKGHRSGGGASYKV